MQLLAGARTGRALDRLDKSDNTQLDLLGFVEELLRVGLFPEPLSDVAKEKAAHDPERVERRVELRHRHLHLT